MTTTEEKVIQILTSYGPGSSRDDAIHAVHSEIGWETAQEFVNSLEKRELVHFAYEVRDGKEHHNGNQGEWKKGAL
ncbi:MAG: hypothetical protein ABSG03_35905 [Bryobacteraceae bacterium]|jgi:hypothetical protein